MAGHLMFISADEVQSVLRYEDLIPAMGSALARFSDREGGGVVQPVRSTVPVAKYDGAFSVMPAYSEQDNALSAKLVCYFPNNKDVPTHNAVIVFMDPTTGVPMVVMDGDVVTTMRTAAASAAVTQAVVKKKPEILAIVGAGVQGHAHYDALSSIYTFSEVRIASRTLASAEKLAAKATNAKVCQSIEEAVRGADIIVVASSSNTPLVKADWVKSGAHINAVGANAPTQQELDPELVRACVVVTDSLDAAKVESGDIIHSKVEVFAEAGELFLGRKEIKTDKTTLFKSLDDVRERAGLEEACSPPGVGVEDAVTGKMVYDKVLQKRAGSK